jgi:dihydrodipicolinate synthase/N-acetylneuraminate lyase
MEPKFRGIYIPLITAFTDDGEVDYEATEEVIEFMVRAGVHGFFVLGSTGMGPVMTTQQRIDTAEFVVKKINRRRPVILHVGAADFQTTVQLARHGDGLGVDAIGIVPPYYRSSPSRVGKFRMISDRLKHAGENLQAQVFLIM